MLGSAAVIVMDETTCMVWAAENLLHFYRHESCGKCTPCREGTDWLHKILRRIERGEGSMRDIDLLERRREQHRRQDALPVRRRGGGARAQHDSALPRRVRGARPRGPVHLPGGLARRWGDAVPSLTVDRPDRPRVRGLRDADAVVGRDGVRRAQGGRVHPAARGAEPRRPDGAVPAVRRRHQADVQGGAAPRRGRHGALPAGAGHLGHRRVHRVCRRAVRRRDHVLRPARPSRSSCRSPTSTWPSSWSSRSRR